MLGLLTCSPSGINEIGQFRVDNDISQQMLQVETLGGRFG